MLKVVYFDEGSATDLINIENRGSLIQEKTNVSETDKEINAGAQTEVGVGKGLKSLLELMFIKVDGETEAEADFLKSNSKLAQSNIRNTILTDFLDLIENKNNPGVSNFDGYDLRVVNNSIAYYQRISPYMYMTDGKMKIDENFDLDMEKIHETLKSGKGYYELIAESDSKERFILRFNNTAFKNNYSVSDLDQMNLSIYAIKVGNMDSNLLDFNYLMESLTDGFSDNGKPGNAATQDNIIDYYEDGMNSNTIQEETEKANPDNDPQGVKKDNNGSDNLDVYDVILAGVSKDK